MKEMIIYGFSYFSRSCCHVHAIKSSFSRQSTKPCRIHSGQWLLPVIVSFLVIFVSTKETHAQVTEKFNCRPNGCCDQHEWCGFWASIGECENNRVWMSINCQIACKSCPQEGGKAHTGQTKGHQPATRSPKPKTLILTKASKITTSAVPTTRKTTITIPTTTKAPTTTPIITSTTAKITTTTIPTTTIPTTIIPTTTIPKTTAKPTSTAPPTTASIKEESATEREKFKSKEKKVPAIMITTVNPDDIATEREPQGSINLATIDLKADSRLITISIDQARNRSTTTDRSTIIDRSATVDQSSEITSTPESTTTEASVLSKSQRIIPPSGPKIFLGNNPTRCEQHRKSNFSNVIEWLIHEGLIAEAEDITFRRTFSTQDIFSSNTQFQCSPRQDFTDCSRNICYNLRYRTLDGSCNNFQNPFFGSAAIPYIRLKPPAYDDGIQIPTATVRGGRPSARDVSRFLLSSPQLVISEKYNTLLMQFGQFLVHDITKTSLLPTDKCIGCTELAGRCTPIIANQFDSRFGCSTPPCCLSFTRSAAVCGTGSNSPRAQLNENTAFIDGSMIYGSSVADSNRLRNGAFMKSSIFGGHQFLPFNQQQCFDVTNCNANFDAGDNRVTIFVGLSAFHTLFLREHNRIAAILQQFNPQWTADRIFHETRKIVGAELQAITFKEWLPKILGATFTTTIGSYKGYDETLDASISSEFSHAAMRFGHGMIQENFNRTDEFGRASVFGSMRFEDGVLKPQRLLFEGGIDPIVRGMITMPLKKPQRVTVSVTEKMFGSTDLVAVNIQRGRDVGLPAYNDWREFCGMKRAQTFDDLSNEILDKNVRTNLQQGYKTPDAMDLYAATLLEDPVVDGLVGPTPACIIGDQFKRIRDGDRFWYQNPAIFTPDQLAELEKASFARILCDNGDNIQTIPPNAFETPTSTNTFAACNTITSMDLSKWTD